MTLRKITIDNSVRYVPKGEQTRKRDSKPKKIKAASLSHKKRKNHHKTIRNSVKKFQHQDLLH